MRKAETKRVAVRKSFREAAFGASRQRVLSVKITSELRV